MSNKSVFSCATALLFAAVASHATPVNPVSYNMPNGNTGSYNYWDDTYTGSGNLTQDGSPLSGGLGDLTDGIIAQDNWFVTEAPAGPGPYVGWTVNPVIDFQFGGPRVLYSTTLYLDDANGAGGVSAPSAVSVSLDGGPASVYPVADPVGSAPFSVTIPLNATAQSVAITLARNNQWVFLSEVTFDGRRQGGNSVPDAGGTLALIGFGLCGMAAFRRSAK